MNNFFDLDKTIYQTYECDRAELHTVWQETTQAWIDLHPDWKYEFSNCEKRKHEVVSILNLSKYAAEAFDKYRGIHQGDLWKFIIASKNGGMYADLDSIPTKSVNELISQINKKTDLITTPLGFQVKYGAGCSNFIFSKNTVLGKNLMNIVYEFLEINGFLLKHSKPMMAANGMDIWCDFIELNRDKIEDIYAPSKNKSDPGYYIHGDSLKPEELWRKNFEKPKKLGIRRPQPKIYSEEWQGLWDSRNSDILSL